MSDLLQSALNRHNIMRQVTAAMIVKTADNVLRDLVDMYMKPDVRVLSYKQGTLTVACRHPAAVHTMQAYCDRLKRKIEEELPTVTIGTVQCRINPEPWLEKHFD